MTTDEHWSDQMNRIAADFEGADVKSFRFTRINGEVTCTVVVLNASHEMVVWELVDDVANQWQTTGFDRWRKLASKPFDPTRPSEVRDAFISTLIR